ncbi:MULTISPECIES: GNAT family N-acetyltransferase [Serratia]|uniref:GNAT family N-acetyltransferase n=1 Tax=Serratia TaxID=613 RepID=UPI000D9F3E68|nr:MULTISPECIES: N-acetyltransferase [Serratia]SPZ53549.1 Predicted acetyltransferase [Serratia quinivorans]RYM75132.1 GNAT family N-acetyltransferase [Serratia liquefaciens]RYM80434.1 GNAT family N-acetyltransferase [Serratia liquefaciens]CAI0948903.1 Predicted acetyltransferase [Serratia proteamaculans]CAI1877729.1 Predicted acetyltransferase [Serratia proteamaculans]
MTFIIRHEESGDICAIEALTAAAFLAEEHSSHTEQFIVNALRHAGALTLSLVAEQDGILIGHAALSPVTVSDGAPGWYGLAPVSVLPTHQNQGIGSQLIRQLLAELQESDGAGCVVLGNPGYYGRFGFRTQTGLTLPGIPAEYFQVLPFGGGRLPQGTVAFHPAFDATE